MTYLLMAMAGLWLVDGLALLVAPLWIIGQIRQALVASPSMRQWSGLTLVAGMILLLQASALAYQGLWMVIGVAMVVKGGFFLLSNEDTCRSALNWCLNREAVDYRFWGLGLCTLSMLLIRALGAFGAQ